MAATALHFDYRDVKLGKLAPVIDSRTLKMKTYMNMVMLPTPPDPVIWSSKVASWPMLLNNKIGNCTLAGALHQQQAWSANAGGLFVPTDAQALAAYESLGYDPNDPTTDQGEDMLTVVKFWKDTGIGGNKIGAYAAVDPLRRSHVTAAAWLLGGLFCGVELPNTAQGQLVWEVRDNSGVDGQPGSWGGHCVYFVDCDSIGPWVITWGGILHVTWRFWEAYFSEAFAIFSPQWLTAQGNSPPGFNKAQLLDDVLAVSDVTTG
jgi:hypothetical protein